MTSVRKAVQRVRGRLRTVLESEWHAFWRGRPVRSDTVLYEAFHGKGMLCNPEAVFRELLAADDMRHLRHIWVLTSFDDYRHTIREFAGRSDVRFVRYRSLAYFRALATAKYLFNNMSFPPQFGKRDGQVYVNTWHGTPLKRMAYDIPHRGPAMRNVLRNFASADYLVSSSEFMTRRMYEHAYRLRGIYGGRVIEEGLPRIDRQFLGDDEARALRRSLRDRGVTVDDDQRIVLYAPTFKESTGGFFRPHDDVQELRERIQRLNEQIDTGRYRVLLRLHYQVYQFAVKYPELRDVLVPNDMSTNALLGITDVLVTDYSSTFYDFLATGRPVLFYVPDFELYSDYRGLYVPTDRWPGPVTDSVDELAGYLNHLGTGDESDVTVSHAELYRQAVETYCAHDDGRAAHRLVDIVFRGRTDGYRIRDDFTDGRESVLLCVGSLATNDTTTALLNLLDRVDYERFDVSLCYPRGSGRDFRRNEEALNPNVRLFAKIGGLNGSKRHMLGRRRLLTRGVDASRLNLDAQRRVFADEWSRSFGLSTFDHIVDFGGTQPYWTYLMLRGEAKTRSIWLRADMVAERSHSTADGRRPAERRLAAVASMYRCFDRLVSVSPSLRDVNRAGLADSAGDAEFTAAIDAFDAEQVTALAAVDLLAELSADPADAVVEGTEADEDGGAAVRDEARRRREERRALLARATDAGPGVRTLVTLGGLTAERNHARLVDAFAAVHRTHPDTRLLVVGDGARRVDLERRVAAHGLTDTVVFAGRQANPYPLLAGADACVLAADHDNQAAGTILAARALGLPIVATDFPSVRGPLPEGVGLVVERTVEALATGMARALDGEVPAPEFDTAAHNRAALEQFYRTLA